MGEHKLTPRYEHICDNCRLIAQHGIHDIYACGEDSSIVFRSGGEASDECVIDTSAVFAAAAALMPPVVVMAPEPGTPTAAMIQELIEQCGQIMALPASVEVRPPTGERRGFLRGLLAARDVIDAAYDRCGEPARELLREVRDAIMRRAGDDPPADDGASPSVDVPAR